MLNVIALNGRLTADPELRHTNSDISVTSFTLAADRNYQRQGQDKQTDFIDIVCWRGTAEFAAKYFHKGQLVAVEGSLQMRDYTDREGNKRRTYEVVASNVFFAESKRSSEQNSSTAQKANYHNSSSGNISSGNANSGSSVSTGDNGDFVEIAGDDDLPF